MYSSARDMAVFLAANLGALPNQRPLQEAMAFAQQGVFSVNPRFTQALGWQVVRNDDLTIVDKNGGLNNTSTYIGMIPQKRLGIVHPRQSRQRARHPHRPPDHARARAQQRRRDRRGRPGQLSAAGRRRSRPGRGFGSPALRRRWLGTRVGDEPRERWDTYDRTGDRRRRGPSPSAIAASMAKL